MPEHSESLEQELLAIKCQLGEPAAFDELVARWHGPLWQYIRQMVDGNELADEILQESWLRILRGIANLREPASLVAWMFGIARRVLMNRFREKYRQSRFIEDSTCELPVDDPDAERVELKDQIRDMLQKLKCLPVQQRELLSLYYLENLSVNQLVQVLGVPAGTVKSRLYNARKTLRQQIHDSE
jgi:RNA polymerase sigma-70 factor (ECF subfamily)